MQCKKLLVGTRNGFSFIVASVNTEETPDRLSAKTAQSLQENFAPKKNSSLSFQK